MLELVDFSVLNPNGDALFAPISCQVHAGAPLAIMGPSGIGKTSLLNAIAGFLPAVLRVRGQCLLDGVDILTALPEHRRIGLMFQDPLLFPHMSVGQNLGFGLPAEAATTRVARAATIEAALERAGLSGFADRRPHSLSGGQRARIALLRALLAAPRALLLDEAFANLDVELRGEFRTMTLDVARNIPVIMVTHDAADANSAARIVTLTQT